MLINVFCVLFCVKFQRHTRAVFGKSESIFRSDILSSPRQLVWLIFVSVNGL